MSLNNQTEMNAEQKVVKKEEKRRKNVEKTLKKEKTTTKKEEPIPIKIETEYETDYEREKRELKIKQTIFENKLPEYLNEVQIIQNDIDILQKQLDMHKAKLRQVRFAFEKYCVHNYYDPNYFKLHHCTHCNRFDSDSMPSM